MITWKFGNIILSNKNNSQPSLYIILMQNETSVIGSNQCDGLTLNLNQRVNQLLAGTDICVIINRVLVLNES